MSEKVFAPCEGCAGQGYITHSTGYGMTVASQWNETCKVCGGSGKGKVIFIKEATDA